MKTFSCTYNVKFGGSGYNTTSQAKLITKAKDLKRASSRFTSERRLNQAIGLARKVANPSSMVNMKVSRILDYSIVDECNTMIV